MDKTWIIPQSTRKLVVLLALLLAFALTLPFIQGTVNAQPLLNEVSFETDFISVPESAGTVSLNVTRVRGYGTGSVKIAIDGISQWYTFAEGEVSKAISIPVTNEAEETGNRLIEASIAGIEGQGLDYGLYPRACIEVLDDNQAPHGPGLLRFDSKPGAEFQYIHIDEEDEYAAVIVQRTGGTDGAVAVNYQTTPGEAQENIDYIGVSGTLVFADGESWKRIEIPIIDNTKYERFTVDFSVILSNPTGGAALGEPLMSIIIINNDTINRVRFLSPSHVEVNEDDGAVSLQVIREFPTGSVTVYYVVTGQTAVGGADYEVPGGSVVLSDGEDSQTITIPIIDDEDAEGTERFSVKITGTSGPDDIVMDPAEVFIDILSSDGGSEATPVLQFKSAAYNAIEESREAVVEVIRTGSSRGEASVYYTVSSGSAESGSDFTAISGWLTFGDNQTSKKLHIPLIDDFIHEGTETFTVSLQSTSEGAVLGELANAEVTVTESDSAPIISFKTPTYYTIEESGLVTLKVIRSGNTQGIANVGYTAYSGSATAGVDFAVAESKWLVFQDGETSKTITIKINDDHLIEYNEDFIVRLTSSINGTSTVLTDEATVHILDKDHLITR